MSVKSLAGGLGLGLLLFVAATGPSQAFSLFGISLFGDQAQKDAAAVIAEPQSYRVVFSVAGNPDLEGPLKAVSQLWQGREAPASGAAGLLATARADYPRLLATLYDYGYYGGTISIQVAGREATQWPADARLPDPAAVVISIDPGPLFHFGKLTLGANRPVPAGFAADTAADFAAGEPAKATVIRRTAQAQIKAYRDLGYAKAKIARQNVVADHKTDRVDVSLIVDPGPKAVIGEVTTSGSETVDPGFIVKASGLEPGRVYSPAQIAQARDRLVALETFSVVRVVEGKTVGPDGLLPLNIVVKDRKPRRISLGATYSTTDGLGVETYWLHRNVFGRAEKLRLDARVAGIGYPVDTAKFDYYFGGTFTKPAFITADTKLTIATVAQRTILTHYTETSIAGSVGVVHQISPDLSGSAKLFAKAANFRDPVYGSRDFHLYGLQTGLVYDGRDSVTDPTSGIYASAHVTPFYEQVYGNSAIKAVVEGRAYYGLGENNRVVLAGRLKMGAILGPPLSQIPPDQLFFAGGGGSVRGYPYRSIGVPGPGGTVRGGKFLTEASVEARVKVTKDVGVVGFVDAGYVTAENFVGLAEGTKVGVGVGLRYETGLGPIRLDLAVPLNKRPGDPNYAIYLGIGQAF